MSFYKLIFKIEYIFSATYFAQPGQKKMRLKFLLTTISIEQTNLDVKIMCFWVEFFVSDRKGEMSKKNGLLWRYSSLFSIL